jgi:hypothetical protein
MQATAPVRCNHARLQPSELFGFSEGHDVIAPCLRDATHYRDSVWDFSVVRYLYCAECAVGAREVLPLASAPPLPSPRLARG